MLTSLGCTCNKVLIALSKTLVHAVALTASTARAYQPSDARAGIQPDMTEHAVVVIMVNTLVHKYPWLQMHADNPRNSGMSIATQAGRVMKGRKYKYSSHVY